MHSVVEKELSYCRVANLEAVTEHGIHVHFKLFVTYDFSEPLTTGHKNLIDTF